VLEEPFVKLKLTVIAGPHMGQEFEFKGHDTFLVGRTSDAHLRLPPGDPYFSRRHFLVEVNPPRCRVIDLNSRNGTLRNGARIQTADVSDGDEIGAGHTVFKVSVVPPVSPESQTLDLPVAPPDGGPTGDY
jgi:serine/threonine-protein kinase